jgi:hypothetical protein
MSRVHLDVDGQGSTTSAVADGRRALPTGQLDSRPERHGEASRTPHAAGCDVRTCHTEAPDRSQSWGDIATESVAPCSYFSLLWCSPIRLSLIGHTVPPKEGARGTPRRPPRSPGLSTTGVVIAPAVVELSPSLGYELSAGAEMAPVRSGRRPSGCGRVVCRGPAGTERVRPGRLARAGRYRARPEVAHRPPGDRRASRPAPLSGRRGHPDGPRRLPREVEQGRRRVRESPAQEVERGRRRVQECGYGTMVQPNIIAWSSCMRLWQCATYGPTKSRNPR